MSNDVEPKTLKDVTLVELEEAISDGVQRLLGVEVLCDVQGDSDSEDDPIGLDIIYKPSDLKLKLFVRRPKYAEGQEEQADDETSSFSNYGED